MNSGLNRGFSGAVLPVAEVQAQTLTFGSNSALFYNLVGGTTNTLEVPPGGTVIKIVADTANAIVNGMLASWHGRTILLQNAGSAAILLSRNNSSGGVGNKFIFDGGIASYTLPPLASVWFWYDASYDSSTANYGCWRTLANFLNPGLIENTGGSGTASMSMRPAGVGQFTFSGSLATSIAGVTGSDGQALMSDGSGNTTWAAPGESASDIIADEVYE